MTSSELDWTVSQAYELDSTDGTSAEEEEEESTDGTSADEEVRMDANSSELTSNKFGANIEAAQTMTKIPSSEILARTIAVEPSALVALPADANAAFSQWLSGSGLAPSSQH